MVSLGQNSAGANSKVEHESDGITISSTWQDCVDEKNGIAKQYIMFSIENRSAQSVIVSFKKNMWYDGTCISCDSESLEYVVSARIDANGKLEDSCTENNGLRIFSKMLNLKDVRQLTHYELSNIKVTDAE